MEIKDRLLAYEEAKQKIRLAEAVLEEHKDHIRDHLEDGQIIETDDGHFYVTNRPTFKFSPEYDEQKEALKERAKEEKATGLATAENQRILTYKTGAPVEKDDI